MLRSSRARLELLRLEGLVPRLSQSWQHRGEEIEQQLAGGAEGRRSSAAKCHLLLLLLPRAPSREATTSPIKEEAAPSCLHPSLLHPSLPLHGQQPLVALQLLWCTRRCGHGAGCLVWPSGLGSRELKAFVQTSLPPGAQLRDIQQNHPAEPRPCR